MQIKFNVSDVLPQLTQLSSLAATKSPVAIYSDIMFATYQSKDSDGVVLVLSSSDGDTWLSHKVTAVSGDIGVRFCINAKDIVSALKNMSDQEITIDKDEETHTVIGTYREGKFSLPYDDAEDYPQAPLSGVMEDSKKTLSAKCMFTAIALTEFAVASDELRLIMNGVHFDFSDGALVSVASDGYKLVKCKQQVSADGYEASFTIPSKAAHLIAAVLEKRTEDVGVSVNATNVALGNSSFSLVARLIEGRYPDYERVIPQNNTNTAVVAAQSLINALSRVRSFAPQSTELLVLKFGKDNIEINADNSDYSKKCCENLHAEYDSEEITIGFKANALMQSIQNIVGENVRISLSDGLHAAILESEEKDNGVEYLSILMPMRVS